VGRSYGLDLRETAPLASEGEYNPGDAAKRNELIPPDRYGYIYNFIYDFIPLPVARAKHYSRNAKTISIVLFDSA
jgi:hypothetical protein